MRKELIILHDILYFNIESLRCNYRTDWASPASNADEWTRSNGEWTSPVVNGLVQ
jgi:hypothetical protein